MWGFWDGAHWKDDAPIFREDWSLKPSGQAFFDLVFDTWWTDTEASTDANGYLDIRGFMGEYEVLVDVNGAVESHTLYLSPGEGVQEATINLAQQVSIGENKEVPQGVLLKGHYPEPANDKITIDLFQSTYGAVQVDMYNVLGQKVRTLYDGLLSPGNHSVTVDTESISSGTYVYRVRSEDGLQQKLLTVRK